MQLICDERERNSTLPFFPKRDDIIIKTIHLGDYAICNGEELLYIFERKTWHDLAESIKDGRYKSQSERLLELKCPKCYIIEGRMQYEPDVIISGLPFKALDTARRHLLIKGFQIIQTKNAESTVDFLLKFFSDFITATVGAAAGKENTNKINEKKPLTLSEQTLKVWHAIGISETALPTVMTYSLRDFINLEDYSSLKYKSGRSFGKKVSESIRNKINSYKAVSAFPGISAASAEYMKIGFRQFINMSAEEIAAVNKSDKSKIGVKCAAGVIAIISFNL
jgi:ERCC4-type nuclease